MVTAPLPGSPGGETVYAYEVDGFGNAYFMDDANLPSLLSLPYFGFTNATDETYLATRKAVLSSRNPWWFNGTAASGVGGPHNGLGYVWCASRHTDHHLLSMLTP
jgi:meiotically up-regulated gene 157 (Mug157) protein